MVMAALHLLGYQDVKNLGGGLGAWKAAELAVETDPAQLVEPAAGEAPAVDAARLADLQAFFTALPDGFFALKPADLNTELAADTGLVILDTRTADEWAGGRIAGAVQPIVLVCASGHRGGILLVALTMLGYTDVRNLGGGMGAWVKAELPVEK
jgi:rhodanese-related sulfurtransferase